jgi:hypothetical protein
MPMPGYSCLPVRARLRKGPTLVPLLVKRAMTLSSWAMSSWISRCMLANAPAAWAAIEALKAVRRSKVPRLPPCPGRRSRQALYTDCTMSTWRPSIRTGSSHFAKTSWSPG